MTNEELILKKLEEVTKKLEEVTIEMKEAREDRAQIKVSQAHHEGNLKVLATKLDDYIAGVRERKGDTNERWKIGGIIASGCLAILSIILAFFNK